MLIFSFLICRLANVCLRQFLDTMLGMTVMYVFFHNNLSDQLAADIITWAYVS